MKKYKIVDKNRFFTFITLVLLLIIATTYILTTSLKAHTRVFQQKYQELRVYPGDTLWDIALRYKPSNYDVRDMVYKIKKFNNMDTLYIFPGETIRVPILNQ